MSEWYMNDDPDFLDARRREANRLVTEPDAEFELLLSNEHDELKSTISHYEQVFESISALCVLHRNGVMDARRVVTTIETILREGANE